MEEDCGYTNTCIDDSNALIIMPKAKVEREAVVQTGKMSSKKRKRMEKFVEKQLKKQEKIAILEKLKVQQAKFMELKQQLSSSAQLVRVKTPPELTVAKRELRQEELYVRVERSDRIQLARAGLPIIAHEQEIVESVVNNTVTLLCGATGSGKTTQVPQFLYEYGFANPIHPKFSGQIVVTQPRRVAAISTARRVAQELNVKLGDAVGYHVRYDKAVRATADDKRTKIKFVTDGILLREIATAAASTEALKLDRNCLESDFLLTKYSVIVVDEAHERTVGIDLLIGFLLRIAKLRNSGALPNLKPLRLVIMSATLCLDELLANEKLFPGEKPPVVQIDGRQFKVAIHYNRKTPEKNFVEEAFNKVSKIHRKLGPGAVLVFLTGAVEVRELIRRLSEEFKSKDTKVSKVDESRFEDDLDGGWNKRKRLFASYNSDDYDGEDRSGASSASEEEQVHFLEGEECDTATSFDTSSFSLDKLRLLPLYSTLSSEEQLRVFDPVPEGERLVVVATNVAETSLTIPGIRYVVDCGKVKSKRYELTTGVERFEIDWTSKASADQRAGRAGRTGMGHCYRLYSSEAFESRFQQFTPPEVLTVPVEGVVLQLKAMQIDNIGAFPFPSAPSSLSLKAAEKLLLNLGALAGKVVTPLGRLMAHVPLAPRFGKALILSVLKANSCGKSQIVAHCIALVAGLTVSELWEGNRVPGVEDGPRPVSDLLELVRVISEYEKASVQSPEASAALVAKYGLRTKAMGEVRKLRNQLTEILKTLAEHESAWTSLLEQYKCGTLDCLVSQTLRLVSLDPNMDVPTEAEGFELLQLMVSCFSDRIARLTPSAEFRNPGTGASNPLVERWRRTSGKLPPLYRVVSLQHNGLAGIDSESPVGIHVSSALYKQRPAPVWVMYLEVFNGTNYVTLDTNLDSDGQRAKMWLKKVSVIDPKLLSARGHPL